MYATTPRTMHIGGIELHVEPPVGEGDPLVLVHGGWIDHTTFDAVVEPLARSFRVIRYDRRGHSRSQYGPGPASRRRDEDDLAELLESIALGPAHLVGTSYGASISLALAVRRPDLVRSVLAHEPPLLGVAPDPDVEALFAGIQDQLAAGDVAGGTRRFFEEAVLGPGSWERIPEPLRRAAMGNAQTFIDLREDPDWATLDIAALSRVPRPILITVGETSPDWLRQTPRAVAEAAGLPTRTISGAGHSPHLTHPDALVVIIEDFALTRVASTCPLS
jgi:pimeloyl-ACP methyl ester carboxylesterase